MRRLDREKQAAEATQLARERAMAMQAASGRAAGPREAPGVEVSKLREMRKQMSAAQDERLRKAKALLERAKALQQASRRGRQAAR